MLDYIVPMAIEFVKCSILGIAGFIVFSSMINISIHKNMKFMGIKLESDMMHRATS